MKKFLSKINPFGKRVLCPHCHKKFKFRHRHEHVTLAKPHGKKAAFRYLCPTCATTHKHHEKTSV